MLAYYGLTYSGLLLARQWQSIGMALPFPEPPQLPDLSENPRYIYFGAIDSTNYISVNNGYYQGAKGEPVTFYNPLLPFGPRDYLQVNRST